MRSCVFQDPRLTRLPLKALHGGFLTRGTADGKGWTAHMWRIPRDERHFNYSFGISLSPFVKHHLPNIRPGNKAGITSRQPAARCCR